MKSPGELNWCPWSDKPGGCHWKCGHLHKNILYLVASREFCFLFWFTLISFILLAYIPTPTFLLLNSLISNLVILPAFWLFIDNLILPRFQSIFWLYPNFLQTKKTNFLQTEKILLIVSIFDFSNLLLVRLLGIRY